VAEEVTAIKHWTFHGNDGFVLMQSSDVATWFIDPMYKYNYQYRQRPHDYQRLASVVRELRGQIIVCEAACPKTGARPDWLPFREFGNRVTSRRKQNEHHHSNELIYVFAN
jgi:hypothetical protein